MTSDPGLPPHDLRQFFRSLGGFSARAALLTAPLERPLVEAPVELIDPPEPVEVSSPPLVPTGFVDGIQASLCVTYRAHRPVYLNYAAAGCASLDGTLLEVAERIHVAASSREREWFDRLETSLPLVELAAERPDDTQAAAASHLSSLRDDLEREVVEKLTEAPAGVLVLDGSLARRSARAGLVGVVKTSRSRYLPDESLLWGMRSGWRSPRFRLPAGSQGCPVERFSCYVRLHDASAQAWDFALVRLEAYDPELLDPLAALALSERQSRRSRDARYDRHLAGVRAVEDLLRARRPAVFSL